MDFLRITTDPNKMISASVVDLAVAVCFGLTHDHGSKLFGSPTATLGVHFLGMGDDLHLSSDAASTRLDGHNPSSFTSKTP